VTEDRVTAFLASLSCSALDGVADASWGALACRPEVSTWAAPVGDDAMADVATAASKDIDMANDKGCLRCLVDMSFYLLVDACRALVLHEAP